MNLNTNDSDNPQSGKTSLLRLLESSMPALKAQLSWSEVQFKNNYVTVIRDSCKNVQLRRDLLVERKKILDLDYNNEKTIKSVQRLIK